MDKHKARLTSSSLTPTARVSWQQARRQASVARVLTLLQQCDVQSLSLGELCRKAGVSERTLRSIFQQVFGIGPNRYLHIRRLHLVRAALALANPDIESVSLVAARFGFTDSGRMAADYHQLFGEYPSQTLRRSLS